MANQRGRRHPTKAKRGSGACRILHLAPWSCPSIITLVSSFSFWVRERRWCWGDWGFGGKTICGGRRWRRFLREVEGDIKDCTPIVAGDVSAPVALFEPTNWTPRGQYPIMHQYPVWATLPCWTPCACPLPRWLATWASFFSLAILFYWPEVIVGESVVFDGELKLFHRT